MDVVIVGAGLAGLAAARLLNGQGAAVRVLEARDRVGGRTVGHTFVNGCTVEMGGQWIGRSHTELLRLVDELGLETFPTYDSGDGFTMVGGSRSVWRDDTLGLPDATEAEIERLHQLIDALSAQVPPDAPWQTSRARELDHESVESWLQTATTDPLARSYFRVLTQAVLAAEAHEVPWLHFLFYSRSGGSLGELIATAGGAQELRVVGGSHRIAKRLAEELPAETLELRAVVRGIRHDENGVAVSTNGGEVHAERAIVTLPPALAGRLQYEPALSADRDALTQSFPMGSVIKIQVLYDQPWWRADGLSGQAVSFDDPIATTFDNSPADARCGVLLGFVEGDHARSLGRLEPAERRRIVLECFERFFGPRARDAIDYAELDWSAERYTSGCYGGRPGAGVWTSFGPSLREQAGRIHWAGAETSEIACGYMEGAVRSGHGAAVEARGPALR